MLCAFHAIGKRLTRFVLWLQERSKPAEPPKKPEAAPFFLPTVAGLSRNPIFNTQAAPTEAEAKPEENGGSLPGWGGDGDEDPEEGAVLIFCENMMTHAMTILWMKLKGCNSDCAHPFILAAKNRMLHVMIAKQMQACSLPSSTIRMLLRELRRDPLWAKNYGT